MAKNIVLLFQKKAAFHRAQAARYEAALALASEELGEGPAQAKVRKALANGKGLWGRVTEELRAGDQTDEELLTALEKTGPLGKHGHRVLAIALMGLRKKKLIRRLARGSWKLTPRGLKTTGDEA